MIIIKRSHLSKDILQTDIFDKNNVHYSKCNVVRIVYKIPEDSRENMPGLI